MGLRLRGGGCGGAKGPELKDDGAPADPLKLLKESLDIVRKNPSMLDESGRKEAAQLLKQWETAITLIAEDVEKEPADNSEIRGSAIEKVKSPTARL